MGNLMTPEAFGAKYGISRAVITRCKQAGAPVRYYGTCGRKYWVVEQEFLDWMDAQGRTDQQEKARKLNLIELREARHRSVGMRKAR